MNKKKATNFEEFEAELLKDQEIKKEYADLKPKYDMIQSLIKRRNQLCMSQSQLARVIGTRQPAISRLERGDYSNVTLSTLIKVANALELDLDISLIEKTHGREDYPTPPGLSQIETRFVISKRQLAGFCRRYHIKKLSLFGSVLREDFRPESDIDVLVEFETSHVPGFGIVAMENELSQLLGRKVDMRTPGDLSRYFRDKVVKEARVEYEHTQL